MTRLPGPIAATAAVTLFLIGACARPADDTAAGAAAAPSGPAGTGLVLQVRQEGGFVPPERIAGRIPAVSVYADGRIIADGPVRAIYPGPALPNLLVGQLDPAEVTRLTEQAAAAGVRTGADLGRPGVADVPATRVDVTTADGTRHSVSAEALTEASADDPQLTGAQRAARAELAAFVRKLTDLGLELRQRYRPDRLAALAQPYDKPADGLPKQPEVAWPGPALPGRYLYPTVKIGCVVVTGAELDTVLAAAADASQNTPWTSGGNTFTVTFRPLLPDETGCADLEAAR